MDELYQNREKLQLGSEFHVVGNLHNWTSEWNDEVLPTPRISATTRMMCWNAGGGAGTLKDDDKLRFLTLTMLQQHIHVACLTEGKATQGRAARISKRLLNASGWAPTSEQRGRTAQ